MAIAKGVVWQVKETEAPSEWLAHHPLCLSSFSKMAELLFYMVKLKALVVKHSYVIQRYHVQYLAQFDALVLNDTIQVLCVLACMLTSRKSGPLESPHNEWWLSFPSRTCSNSAWIMKGIMYWNSLSSKNKSWIQALSVYLFPVRWPREEHVCLPRGGVNPDQFICLHSVCPLHQTRWLTPPDKHLFNQRHQGFPSLFTSIPDTNKNSNVILFHRK